MIFVWNFSEQGGDSWFSLYLALLVIFTICYEIVRVLCGSVEISYDQSELKAGSEPLLVTTVLVIAGDLGFIFDLPEV